MAIGATVYKVSLTIADMDRQYYQVHELTVAMHPSENNHRFMVRIIAFALNADEQLLFTKGLGADDEPEVWQKSLAGDIELWIDFGQIDEKRIRRACGRAKKVSVYTYQRRKAMLWWEQHKMKFVRHENLKVFHIEADGAEVLVKRNMQLQCNIDDGSIFISDENHSLAVTVQNLN